MKDNLLQVSIQGILLLLLLPFLGWSQMNEAAQRGREIFRKGMSEDDSKIMALMSGTQVPATVLPCASCHGMDGRGRPEGGVVPSNITWEALTKNYDGKRSNGRQHPAYNKAYLKRAIAMGLDPAGNPLNASMPKYQMNQQQMDDLVAYLQVLGQEAVEGVTDTTLIIGALFRSEPGFAEMNEVVGQIIRAYFAEINGQGGLFNRQLELQALQSLDHTPPFALVSSWVEVDPHLPEGLPVVGGMASFPEEDASKNQSLFYLLPGLRQMATALGKQVTKDKIAIVYRAGPTRETLVDAFLQGIPNRENTKIIMLQTDELQPEAIVSHLEEQGVAQVFLLGEPVEEKQVCDHLALGGAVPELLLLGSFTAINIYELPSIWNRHITLAYPQWISSASEKGRAMVAYLQQKYQLSTRYQQSQWAALAGAILLVDGLKRVGRILTREKLVATLENTYQLDTGLLPPLSFTANRRIGSEKIFMLRYEGKEKGLLLLD